MDAFSNMDEARGQPRYRSWALQGLLCLVLGACGPSAEGPSEPGPADPPTPTQANPLARVGPHRLGLDEVREAVAEARALQHWRSGQRPPEEALKGGELRVRLVEQAMDRRLVRAEVERRGLEIPADEVDALLERAAQGLPPDAAPVAGSDPATLETRLAARYGEGVLYLREVAMDLVRNRVLTERLVAEVTDAELQRLWRSEETRVDASLVSVIRVPTGPEIDAFERTRADEIERYFQANADDYAAAARRRVRRVFFETDGQDPGVLAQLRTDAETTRRALEAGTDFDALTPSAGMRVTPWRVLSRAQFPPAFDGPVHRLSEVVQSRKGFVVFRVEEEIAGEARTLADPRVRREIAAQLRGDQDDLPTAKATAARVARLLGATRTPEALTALLEEHRLELVKTGPFSQANGERVPRVGHAPALHAALFGAQAGQVVGPFTVRQHYVVARVDRVDGPTSGAWARVGAEWSARWRARNARNRLEDWLLAQSRDTGRAVDREALLALPWEQLAVSAPGSSTTGAPLPPQAASVEPRPIGSPSGAPRP